MKKLILLFILFQSLFSYSQEFGRKDSLRGFLYPERTCYDVSYYHLKVSIDPEEKYLKGYSEIHFEAQSDFELIQIDLFENMKISEIQFEGRAQEYSREFNAVFVNFDRLVKSGEQTFIRVYYAGNPRVAISPPWDGGFSWKKDKNGKDWIGVSCQG
jgi:aminopeptidase N